LSASAWATLREFCSYERLRRLKTSLARPIPRSARVRTFRSAIREEARLSAAKAPPTHAHTRAAQARQRTELISRVNDGPLRTEARSRVPGGGRRVSAHLLVLRNLRLLPRLNLGLLLQPHSGEGLPNVGCGAMRVLKRRIQNRFQGASFIIGAP